MARKYPNDDDDDADKCIKLVCLYDEYVCDV